MGKNIPIVTSLQKYFKKIKDPWNGTRKLPFVEKSEGVPKFSILPKPIDVGPLDRGQIFFLSFHNNRIIQYMYTYNRNGNPLKIKGEGKLIFV